MTLSKIIKRLSYLLFVASLSACTRATEEVTDFSIQIPSAKQMNSMVAGQSAIEASLLCFVVDIQGGSIRGKASETCQPAKGQMIGSVKPGELLSGSITQGTYDFKIYALRRDSIGEVCPSVNTDTWNWPLAKIYLVGQANAQKIQGEKADISIVISTPDINDNIITQNSMPSSCYAVGNPSNQLNGSGRIQMASTTATGTNLKLYSRINASPQLKNLVGSQYKIQNWKVTP